MGAIVVTGVPGVGKTTVMEAAAEERGLEVVVFGTEMFRIAKAKGYVEDRDAMRRLEPARQREVQKQAAVDIAAMGDVIVDTHCTVQTPKGFLPGLPVWVLEALKPSTIVLVEATPEEIQRRRLKDESRTRDPDTTESIRLHQELNRAAAMAYAALTGATVGIVTNHDGKVDEAIQQILPVVA
jgi:adenylate kinase